MCLHDDIVFIHQRQIAEGGGAAALSGDGGMTEHLAAHGWHANLTAGSHG